MMKRNEVFELISKERERQISKWGNQSRGHVMVWLTILIEEVGEIGHAILHKDWDGMEDEIVQVAAVAVAWLEEGYE